MDDHSPPTSSNSRPAQAPPPAASSSSTHAHAPLTSVPQPWHTAAQPPIAGPSTFTHTHTHYSQLPQPSATASMASRSDDPPTNGRPQHIPFPFHILNRTSTSPPRRWQLRHHGGSTLHVPYISPRDTDTLIAFHEQHEHIHEHDDDDPSAFCLVAYHCERCFCTSMDDEVVEMFVPARWVPPGKFNDPWNPIPDDYAADFDLELALRPSYIRRLRIEEAKRRIHARRVKAATKAVETLKVKRARAEREYRASKVRITDPLERSDSGTSRKLPDSGPVPGQTGYTFMKDDESPSGVCPRAAVNGDTILPLRNEVRSLTRQHASQVGNPPLAPPFNPHPDVNYGASPPSRQKQAYLRERPLTERRLGKSAAHLRLSEKDLDKGQQMAKREDGGPSSG